MAIFQSIYPFIELTRLSNPTGSCLTIVPYLIGFLASLSQSKVVIPSNEIVKTQATFVLAGIVLHSAGCTWNDVVDADIDRNISRTKDRPVPRGAVSKPAAIAFAVTEFVVWIWLLTTITSEAALWGMPQIPTVLLYPYCKRFTGFPSVFLGVTLALGVFTGAYAYPSTLGMDVSTAGLWCHFMAFVLWMSIIDMIYGYQDIKGDLKTGVLSMAVTFKNYPKTALGFMALMQCLFIGAAGYFLGVESKYCVGIMIGVGSLNLWMLSSIQLEDPNSCWWWFQVCSILIQGAVLLSMSIDL